MEDRLKAPWVSFQAPARFDSSLPARRGASLFVKLGLQSCDAAPYRLLLSVARRHPFVRPSTISRGNPAEPAAQNQSKPTILRLVLPCVARLLIPVNSPPPEVIVPLGPTCPVPHSESCRSRAARSASCHDFRALHSAAARFVIPLIISLSARP